MFVRFERFPVARPLLGTTSSVNREIDNIVDMFLSPPLRRRGQRYPAVDVVEYENETILVVEVPGLKKDNLKITLDDGRLAIEGEPQPSELPQNATSLRREILRSTFRRTFELPHPVKADAVSADVADGILRITLPKAEEARPRHITVN